MNNELSVWVAANITYSGLTYNTRVLIEYKHTGKQYFKSDSHYTTDETIATEWKAKGKKVIEKPGYYYIKRLAIPSNHGAWYINNPGDNYQVNKVSRYGKRIHEQLSNNINPFK